MHLPRTITAAIATTAVSLAALLPAAAAGASPDARRVTVPTVKVDLSKIKSACDVGVSNRTAVLTGLQAAVNVAPGLTDAHRSSLSGEVSSASSGLQGLKGQIDAASNLKTLANLCGQIVTTYRVYVLEIPTVHLTIGGDHVVKASNGSMARLGKGLDRTIQKMADAGHDVTGLKSLKADFDQQVAAARSAAAPIGDTVLPLTPAQYNGGSAQGTLSNARNNLATAHLDMSNALTDAGKIIDQIESTVGTSTTTS